MADPPTSHVLLTPMTALACSIAVLGVLVALAAAIATCGGSSLATSPLWVRITAWILAPGFLIDGLVSESLHHGTPRLFDWIIMVGVSWLAWNTVALLILVAIEKRRARHLES